MRTTRILLGDFERTKIAAAASGPARQTVLGESPRNGELGALASTRSSHTNALKGGPSNFCSAVLSKGVQT